MSSTKLWTTGKLAAELGVDRWQLQYLIEHGDVQDASVRVPGRRLFTASDVAVIRAALAKRRDARSPPMQQSTSLLPGRRAGSGEVPG